MQVLSIHIFAIIARPFFKGLAMVFLLNICQVLSSQGMLDSLFSIEEAHIHASLIRKAENAGLKEVHLDSLVIQEKLSQNLSGLLAENTSVYIKDYGRGALATASFRGTAPSHTQVSWNGLNINSPMLGMVDFSLIPVYIIDDVSLEHGAASISSGSGGLGGQININNSVNWNNRLGGRIYQGIGSYYTFDTYGQLDAGTENFQSKTRIYQNYSNNNYDFLNNFKYEEINGERYFPTEELKGADFAKYGFMQEFYVKHNSAWISSGKLWIQDANRFIPMSMSNEGADTAYRTNKMDDLSVRGVIDSRYYGEKINFKLFSGINHQQVDYVLKIKSVDEHLAINSGSKLSVITNSLVLDYIMNEKIYSTTKVDLDYSDVSTMDTARLSGYKRERLEYSFFYGVYVTPFEKMNVAAEIRKDFISSNPSPFVYNLGIEYYPAKQKHLAIKASFSQNHHTPSLNDLYWQPGGNPDLKPERSKTIEGGFQYKLINQRTTFESEITAYHSNVDDWILWLPSKDGYWEAINITRVVSNGLEANLNVRHSIGKSQIGIHANYAYTKSVNLSDSLSTTSDGRGYQLPYIPVHSANALLNWRYRYFHISYQYQNYGIQNLLNSNRQGRDDNVYPFERLYALHLNHLTIGKEFKLSGKTLGTQLKIYNIFDEVYRNVLSRYMPGRHYMFILNYTF